MRNYGRQTNTLTGEKTWVMNATDAQGSNDRVYLTALAQALLLNLGESPFYADAGLPAHPSVVTQVVPDYYVMLTQKRFAPFFAALTVARQNTPDPVYVVNATTNQGYKVNFSVPIPI